VEETHIPRNIYRPIIVPYLGLELSEAGITVAFPLCVLVLVMTPFLAILLVAVGNCIYVKLRKGKPRGWVIHRFYKTGLPLSDIRGLLNARVKKYEISPGPRKKKELSIFGKEEEILRSVD